MKRLFYTSCLADRSVSGAAGFQVRAASPDLSPDEQASALEIGAYHLPRGVPDDVPPDTAPRRLALLDRPNGRRVACHSVYVGADPGTKRMGNYFSDFVIGRAEELDPLAVLGMWKAPFWRTRDGDDLKTPALDDVRAKDLVPGTELTPARLQPIARANEAVVEFLLHGLLVTDPNHRLFLVARPEVSAAALFTALTALPPALRSSVTFSTYEREPGSCAARVVGTTWAEGTAGDLEEQCYSGTGCALNTAPGGRATDLGEAPAFVRFALEAFKAGKPNDLTAFHKDCETRKVATGPEVALLYRLSRDKAPLSATELSTGLAVGMAKELLARPEMGRTLVKLAIDDPTFRRDPWPAYLRVILADPTQCRELAEYAWTLGLAAAKKDNEFGRCRTAWEDVLPKLAPATSVGKRLLDEVKNPEQELPFETRLYWLPKVLAAAGGFDRNPAAAVWCNARPEVLSQVLAALKNDESAKRKVTARTLRSAPGAVPETLLDLLGREPDFAVGVVGEVAQSDAKKADETFKQVVKRFPKTDWAKDLMAAVPVNSWPVDRLDRCLVVAIEGQSRFDVRAWLGENAKRVRGELEKGRTPVLLAAFILDSYAKEWGQHPDLKKHLDWVWKTDALKAQLPPAVQDLLAQQYGISAFCAKPEFDDSTLSEVKQALEGLDKRDERPWWQRALAQNLPFGAHRFRAVVEVESERVFEAVANALLALPPGAGRQAALESVLAWLSPSLSPDGTWVGLYKRLLARCVTDDRIWRSSGLLSAFVAVCSGDIQREDDLVCDDPRCFIDMSEGVVRTYGSQLRSNASTPGVAGVQGLIKRWAGTSNSDRKKWATWWKQQLSGAARSVASDWPKKVKEGIREAFVILGVLLVALVVLTQVSPQVNDFISKLLRG